MKRFVGDAKLIKKTPLDNVDVFQDNTDMLTWYFLLKGAPETDYENGLYIGKIMHNPEYPFKAPDFMMLTPNGRFDIGKKICLTNSGYHQESWSAMWNIRSLLEAFLSIMSDDSTSGISHILKTKHERQTMAKDSFAYNETYHKEVYHTFTRFVDGTDPVMDKINKKKEEKEKKKKEKEKKKHDKEMKKK